MSALDKALDYSRKLKIDECEIVHVERKITTIRITDSEIFELKQNLDERYGIRLIQDKKISSIQTSDENEINKSIDDSLQIIPHLKPREFWKSLPHELKSNSLDGTYDKKLAEISGSEIADIAQDMINHTLDQKITAISGSINIVSEKFQIANSSGLSATDKGTYISGIINADSNIGMSEVSGIGQGCCRTLEKFSAEQIGTEAKTMCVESINPKKCETGEYTIVFEPYSVGELLAFVIASNFNFKTYSEKRSCFSNRYNEKIAVDEFSLIDNPHISQGIGSKVFDDEGVKTKFNTYVDNGLFTDTYSNLFDSFKENRESTGNASRPGSPMGRSAEAIPVSMPHNLQVKSGSSSQEDMIKDTKHGLLVGRLWYTYAVNPIKGDFSCTARSGIRIIENGKIKNPGKSVRIIHNLPSLLQNISSIGNNEKNVLQWASLPSITPSIKVEKIKVISI
ncbi:MAG TPA: TldD/PmbA family protein [Nitrosopumilaceae archaeon]|nr:TldD/PmbA family protein [Nitrosopumilaceae archaeon]